MNVEKVPYVFVKVQVCVPQWKHSTIGVTPPGVELLDKRKEERNLFLPLKHLCVLYFPWRKIVNLVLPTKLPLIMSICLPYVYNNGDWDPTRLLS